MSHRFVLRPLSVGELLDAAFRLARRLFPSLVVLQLVAAAVPLLLALYLAASGSPAASPSAGVTALLFVTVLINVVFTSLAAGAASYLISEAYLGRTITAGEALQRAAPRVGPIIVASILTGLVAFCCMLPFIVVVGGAAAFATAGATRGSAAVGLVGFLLGLASLALPLWVVAGFALQTPSAALEPALDGIGAMRRSWGLTRGFRLRIFGVGLVIGAIFGAILVGLSFLIGFALPQGSVISAIAGAILQAGAGLLVFPVLYAVLTLLYYDLRVRKEGFDLEMLAATLPSGPAARL